MSGSPTVHERLPGGPGLPVCCKVVCFALGAAIWRGFCHVSTNLGCEMPNMNFMIHVLTLFYLYFYK